MDGKSIKEVVYETMKDLHEGGFLSDERMRHFDFLCKGYTPKQIRQIRKKTCSSRDDFASHLHVSKKTVEKWESGQTKPSRVARKLLNIVDRKGLEAID